MGFLLKVLHILILNAQAQAQLTDIQPEEVAAFVSVAVFEETDQVSAELLVSLAWGESRFKQDSEPGCGVLQVFPQYLDGHPDWTCKVLRNDLVLAVRSGVVGLEQMLDDKRVHGDLHRALMYRACGNKFFEGTCNEKKGHWVKAAEARAQQLTYHPSHNVREQRPSF